MTALATPPVPSTRPRPGDEARTVTVFANLLPEEVVAGRRLRGLQRNIVAGLAGLIVLLIGVYAFSWWQTENSRADLSGQQQRTTVLQNRLKDYAPLLAAQAQAAGIGQTLTTLMTNDLSWRDLINRMEQQAHRDVVITGVTGTVIDPTATTTTPSGLELLNESGQKVAGTLTITGTSHTKSALAAFVDRLGAVRGVTVPLPASVTAAAGSLTYSINALITADALGGRFSGTPTAAGGK